MADQRQHVERVLGVMLHAPVGLALTIRDQWPRQLRQHRQAIENRVQLARFVGELAVRYGRAEIERELRERRTADDRAEAPAAADQQQTAQVDAVAPSQPATVPAGAPAATVEPQAVEVRVTADDLPIGNYESLAAIHVVQRLGSLRQDEIEQIRRFESTHRARRTVLAKIAQLQQATAS